VARVRCKALVKEAQCNVFLGRPAGLNGLGTAAPCEPAAEASPDQPPGHALDLDLRRLHRLTRPPSACPWNASPFRPAPRPAPAVIASPWSHQRPCRPLLPSDLKARQHLTSLDSRNPLDHLGTRNSKPTSLMLATTQLILGMASTRTLPPLSLLTSLITALELLPPLPASGMVTTTAPCNLPGEASAGRRGTRASNHGVGRRDLPT
jgi:hypothetical protein